MIFRKLIFLNPLRKVKLNIKIQPLYNIALLRTLDINRFNFKNSFYSGYEKLKNSKKLKSIGFKKFNKNNNDYSNIDRLYFFINNNFDKNSNLEKNLSEISLSKSINL